MARLQWKKTCVTDGSFVIGVNYWPRSSAMHMWKRFDEKEIEADFALCSDVGLKLVRIFLLWEDFQDHPQSVNEHAIEKLRRVADIASAHSLWLDITFFVGHMSGPNWCPRWMLLEKRSGPLPPGVFQVISDNEIVAQRVGKASNRSEAGEGDNTCDRVYRNFFHDEEVQQSQEALLRAVVRAVGAHPSVALWNLGNEVDQFAIPRTRTAARLWIARMCKTIRDTESELNHHHQQPLRVPITCGLHVPSILDADINLRVDDVWNDDDTFWRLCDNGSSGAPSPVPSGEGGDPGTARLCDVPVIHGYACYHLDLARGPLDPLFIPFLCHVTCCLLEGEDSRTATANELNREGFAGPPSAWGCLAEEFGACTQADGIDSAYWEFHTAISTTGHRKQFMASRVDFSEHLSILLRALWRIGSPGALLWCFADYDRSLYAAPPCNEQRHERFFGIVDRDGRVKEHVRVIREFLSEERHRTRLNPGDARDGNCGIGANECRTATVSPEENSGGGGGCGSGGDGGGCESSGCCGIDCPIPPIPLDHPTSAHTRTANQTSLASRFYGLSNEDRLEVLRVWYASFCRVMESDSGDYSGADVRGGDASG
eukprot:TRINITY_DN6265_c0_g2_i1.p1 TRINITY_DN6265_c0_g2~~TRINITY_DN6265_c0_g2_i1.p1  ORF type:complete len:599 (-),score=68.34 TRINITY_DN6265_c0_g2_i1:182-1978(-)